MDTHQKYKFGSIALGATVAAVGGTIKGVCDGLEIQLEEQVNLLVTFLPPGLTIFTSMYGFTKADAIKDNKSIIPSLRDEPPNYLDPKYAKSSRKGFLAGSVVAATSWFSFYYIARTTTELFK